MKRLLLVWVLFFCLGDGMASAQGSEPIFIGYGWSVQWSPTEKFLSHVSRSRDTLFVASTESPQQARPIFIAPIAGYGWLDDSTLAVREISHFPDSADIYQIMRTVHLTHSGRKKIISIDSMDLRPLRKQRLAPFAFSDSNAGYLTETLSSQVIATSEGRVDSSKETESGGVLFHLETIPRGNGKVWMIYRSDEDSQYDYGMKRNGRQATLSENYYHTPTLAPSRDRFFCWAMRGDLVVFDTLGNELANLGRASTARWDGKGEFITFSDEYGHYDFEKSEVYLGRYDGSVRRQLTDTPDRVEIDPRFSPLGNFIVYREYPTGGLHVIKTR